MPTVKLTKTAADAAFPRAAEYELRDTAVPGFMLKVIPLFNNGGAAVAEARARRRAREAELGLARIEAETSVVAAEARSRAAVEAALTAQSAASDAARLGPIAEAAYQGGESGVIELVDAYRTARDAGTETIELFERAARARIDLELAQGSVSDAGF